MGETTHLKLRLIYVAQASFRWNESEKKEGQFLVSSLGSGV